MATKKLIEVALPLEKINAESAREKSIRTGHPSTIHMWWARRPLATARAVIWSSLVDDPSSHPELFPTEEEQSKERQRLFKILEGLVIWENSNNETVLEAAKKEILKSTKGNPPELLDPFAGGGTIPLEGYRLGLKVHAHDLNPVAVMINRSMIDIPAHFINYAPVNPETKSIVNSNSGWIRASGLSKDVEYYGNMLGKMASHELSSLYPPVVNNTGEKFIPIAWIWSRTGKCPNPACGKDMPLASTFILSKKKGNEVWVEPISERGKLSFKLHYGKCAKEKETNKQGRSAIFRCPFCGEVTTDSYVKSLAKANKMGAALMGIVCEGKRGRVYIEATLEQELAANVTPPEDIISGKMPENPRWFSPPAFGMTEYKDLFTNRQLYMLSVFSRLVKDIQKTIEKDAIEAGLPNDHISIAEGGEGARAYSEGISVYLAFILDKLTDRNSSICSWINSSADIRPIFARQAIPMSWDYAEANPFSNSVGCWKNMVQWVVNAINNLPVGRVGSVKQFDAQSDCGLRNIMVSTDPPYYDNIGYADLSDYYYIWMRNSLKDIYNELFNTMMVPKTEELIATPYRFDGNVKQAKAFFEDGMLETCKQIYKYSSEEYPVTIYYAYKQSDTEEDEKLRAASSGWETMLSAIINAGLSITGTWPVRTEREGRTIGNGTNALASSIVLVCRKRPENATQTTRRNLINILRRELRPALKKLQESNIAPVDLAQSAIGPGMGVFSRYRKVLEADGTPMTVRSALQVINEEIDLYFNEQVGDLDSMSRFCVDLFTQNAFNDIKFGDADILARAKGTSVATLAAHDVVYAKAGTVHLIERTELPEKIDNHESCIWLLTQQLTQAMATGGVEACAKAVYMMFGSNAERAKDLAYRLYTIAEQKKWSTEAFAYNALVVAWPDIQSRAAMMQRETPEQLDIFSMGLLNT